MPIYAAIIGVDGSGKSTCFRKTLASLAESHTVMGIGDRVYLGSRTRKVEEYRGVRWAGVKEWFRGAAKRMHNPLLYEITKLTELVCWSRIQKELYEYHKPEVILGDGAPLINIAGWGIRYHPDFFHRSNCAEALRYLSGMTKVPIREAPFYIRRLPEIILLNWSGIAVFPMPQLTFFLQVTPRVALDRIRRRGEELQVHETLDFLSKLQNGYDLICDILESDFRRTLHRISVDDLTAEQTVAKITRIITENIPSNELPSAT